MITEVTTQLLRDQMVHAVKYYLNIHYICIHINFIYTVYTHTHTHTSAHIYVLKYIYYYILFPILHTYRYTCYTVIKHIFLCVCILQIYRYICAYILQIYRD